MAGRSPPSTTMSGSGGCGGVQFSSGSSSGSSGTAAGRAFFLASTSAFFLARSFASASALAAFSRTLASAAACFSALAWAFSASVAALASAFSRALIDSAAAFAASLVALRDRATARFRVGTSTPSSAALAVFAACPSDRNQVLASRRDGRSRLADPGRSISVPGRGHPIGRVLVHPTPAQRETAHRDRDHRSC